MRESDVNFVISILIHCLNPPKKANAPPSGAAIVQSTLGATGLSAGARIIPQVALPADSTSSRAGSVRSQIVCTFDSPRQILLNVVFLGKYRYMASRQTRE